MQSWYRVARVQRLCWHDWVLTAYLDLLAYFEQQEEIKRIYYDCRTLTLKTLASRQELDAIIEQARIRRARRPREPLTCCVVVKAGFDVACA